MTQPATAEAVRPWTVEQKGIDWVSDDERRGVPSRLFWPWTAANFSFFTIAYGVFVTALGLSWWQAIIAVLVGLGLSYPIVGLAGLAGMRGGAPTMTLSRAAFGYHGNKLPTLFVYLSLVGWETVSVVLGTLATGTIMRRLDPDLATDTTLAVSFGITTVLAIVIGIYGYEVILRVQKWITLTVAVMTIMYLVLIVPKLDWSIATPAGSVAVLVGGVMLVFANGIGWTPGGADYSRYLPRASSPKSVIGWTAFGGGFAPAILMCFGVLLSSGNPDLARATVIDPIGAFATQLPTWFLIPFLAATLLSVIAGAVYNLYSSGLNLLALGVRLSRPVSIVIDGVLMVLGGIYLVFISPSFFAPVQAFIIVIGVVVAAWAAVFVVDLLLHRKDGFLLTDLYTPAGAYGRFNIAGMTSLIVAIVIGLGMVTSFDPHIQKVLGYLLTDAARQGSLGASNIGVALAFLIAGALYAVLSTTVLRHRSTEASAHGGAAH
jgi:NCS1 family nucleobase:cation symporter-1